jgi:3-hydroxypropanoate dehydrogenase
MNASIAVTAEARRVNDQALGIIFRDARTRKAWRNRPVPEEMLRRVFADAIMGPTAENSQPLRVVFVASASAKRRLAPALDESNVNKMMTAPVTAIFAFDLRFHEFLIKTFPHMPDARSWYEGNAPPIQEVAFRNATLQAAYFMLAARAHGLDCGPMSGFDQAKVNAEFFPDGRWRANFLCNIGYGGDEHLHPRGPRLSFDEVCRID